MMVVLSVAAVLLSMLGALFPSLVAFAPFVGTWLIYRLRAVRRTLVIAALLLAVWLYVLRPTPGQAVVCGVVAFFAVFSIILKPARLLVPMDHPEMVPAAEASLGDDAIIVGTEINGEARAWSMESLVPHHIVNDRLGGWPILVAY